MKKRKILFITPSLCQGGIEHSQITMLKLLDFNKYDITLFTYLEDMTLLPMVPDYVNVISDKDDTHYHRDIKVVFLKLKKKLFTLLGNRSKSGEYGVQLRSYIHEQRAKHPAKDVFKDEHFDVIVSNAVGICTEMALHISAEKRYVFFRSSVDLHHDMLERVFPRYDGIVAVSAGVQTMLQKAYPMVKDKILLLENYVDAETILEKANVSDTDPSLEDNITTICSCGRLSSEKGFDTAVEAAAVLDKEGYSFKWYFIGDGQEREKVEALIKNYSLEEKIVITGYMDNPFGFMKNCDIYVQPSYEESYGRTIKEAIILGCPVVSTATVGGKTLVRDKENGILTEINSEALAEGIKMLIDDEALRTKLGAFYSVEQNAKEKQIFKEGLENLLS